MSVSYEVDLKETLNQINQKLDNLQKDVTDLKIGVARLEERVGGLEDKIEGLGKRIDSQEFISRGVLIGLVVAILGGLAKLIWIGG
ncbi:MAG: hypothetical protein HC890_05440 [Chloroflexaceae bacterium]|nr:hypothetical protein [Chloroflexaceae bacterium]